jgi:hypothetical protein
MAQSPLPISSMMVLIPFVFKEGRGISMYGWVMGILIGGGLFTIPAPFFFLK